MMHLHIWTKYVDLEYSELKYEINRIYRSCYRCNKWQREIHSFMESWWEDSYEPIGVEGLFLKDIADEIIKDIQMRRNAQRITK
jgi:hypothetical protein